MGLHLPCPGERNLLNSSLALKPISRYGQSLLVGRDNKLLEKFPPTLPAIPKKIRIIKLHNGKVRQLRQATTLSGYQHFHNKVLYDVRQQAVRVFPTMTEVAKLWRATDAATRSPFLEQAAADKLQARIDFNLEYPVVQQAQPPEMSQDLAEAVAALPPSVKTGYHVFLKEVSQGMKEKDTPMDFGDGVRAASALWKTMSLEQKQPYLDTANKGKQAWLDQRKNLNARLKAAGHEVIPQKDPKNRRGPSPPICT